MNKIKYKCTFNQCIKTILFFILFFFTHLSAQENQNLNNKFNLARNYEISGKFEKAISIYKELIKIQPFNSQFTEALNSLYLRNKNYDESLNLLSGIIKENPMIIQYYGLLGSTYYTMNQYSSAFAVWDSALVLDPKSVNSYKLISNYALQNRAFEKAAEILKRGQLATSDPLIFSFDLANIYSATMQFKEAAKEYCQLLKTNPEYLPSIKNRLTESLARAGVSNETVETVEDYYNNDQLPVYLDLLGFLYTLNNNYEKAFETTLALDKVSGNNGSAVYNFAQISFTRGEFLIASKAYQYVVNNFPLSAFTPTAKIGLARTLQADIELQLRKKEPEWNQYELYDTLNSYRYLKVIEAYKNIIRDFNNNPVAYEAMYQIGCIYTDKMKNDNDALKNFLTAVQNPSTAGFYFSSLYRIAEIYIRQNDLISSGKYLNEIILSQRSTPDQKQAASYLLAKLSFWKFDFNGTGEKLKDVTDNLSNDSANDAIELSVLLNSMKNDSLGLVNLASADFFSVKGDYAEAYNIFNALSVNSKLFILRDYSKYRAAQLAFGLGKNQEGIQILENIIASEDFNVYADKSYYLLANAYLYSENLENKAISLFEKFLEKFPNSLYFSKVRQVLMNLQKNGNKI